MNSNKNHIVLVVCVALVLSCTVKEGYMNSHSNNRYTESSIVERAKQVYKSFFPETKSNRIDVSRIEYVIENMDTLGVNVDFCDDNGFVLLRTDGVPLLVMSKGSLRESLDDVPAFELTYKCVLDRYHPLPDPIDTSFTEIVYNVISDSVTHSISPLIEVNMHQGYPFNIFAPNGVAGCTPVSIAQAFSVFESPDSIAVTFDGSVVDSTELSWANMKTHLNYHSNSCVYCTQNGYLLREIGNRCNASYNSGSTGAWPTISCINSFGYTAINGYSYDDERIMSSLDLGFPVIISGFNHGETVGHSWNIDGYYVQESLYSVDTMRGLTIILHNWNEYHERVYMHFNYGWGGYSNGYVLARDTKIDYMPDGEHYKSYPISIFSNDYPVVKRLVTHIKPNDYE
jgi:hypothetical protein